MVLYWCAHTKTTNDDGSISVGRTSYTTHTILLNDDGSNYDGRTNGYTHTFATTNDYACWGESPKPPLSQTLKQKHRFPETQKQDTQIQ
jgi:hypothetical protein